MLVDVVDSFVYLGSSVDATGGNDSDIRRRIELPRTCMKSLDRGTWRSSISLQAQALQCLYSSGAPVWLGHMECDRSVKTASWCFWPGFLANTTAPPQAVWAHSSGCSLRGPLTCAMSIHRSPPCWLASPKRPTPSVLSSNNRQRSQTTQPFTSLCIMASIGSSFLVTHRGNGYALRACHQMMMMM